MTDQEFKQSVIVDLSESLPIKSYEVEKIPVSKHSDVFHSEAELVQNEILEFRFQGQFLIGGKAYRLTYNPGILSLFGARERYTSQGFFLRSKFTHHIFDSMTDEELGKLIREEFNKFKKSVEDWKKT